MLLCGEAWAERGWGRGAGWGDQFWGCCSNPRRQGFRLGGVICGLIPDAALRGSCQAGGQTGSGV